MDENMNDNENIKTEIVIIGGGGSGLAAAVSAAEKGAEVLVIEKRSTFGGNSSMAGGIFAAESRTQKRLQIDTSKDDCFKAAMDHAHWKINPRIIRTIIDKSGDTIRWLEEKGIKLEIPVFYPDLPKSQRMKHLRPSRPLRRQPTLSVSSSPADEGARGL